MARDAEIVVIGAGIAGVAAARAIAQSGREVIVLEQFDVGHDRGSSHGGSRIFRLSYPDPHYVRLAQGALQAWRELEDECGEQLILPTGGLDFGSVAVENARALASCGVGHELLTGAEVMERWAITAAPDEVALFQPDGGITLADRAHAACLSAAVEAGALVLANRRVTGIDVGSGFAPVRISTDAGEIVARACVVTAGAWARDLLAGAEIDLPVVPTRETTTYFALEGALEIPPVIDAAVPDPKQHGLRRPGLISFALGAPGIGLKAGLHHAGPPTDPDEPGTPDSAAASWVAGWAARRYPGLSPAPVLTETCIYTNTADESFILERHGRVVVASACSGHGFKFAPVFGRTIAALARDAAV